MDFYNKNDKSAHESLRDAWWIAYAPFVFQVSKTATNTGILALIKASRSEGLSINEIAESLKMSVYSVRVLLSACLGIGLVFTDDEKFFLTKTGTFLLSDPGIKVTMDFTHDVCYQGLFFLEESIMNNKPEGLKVFGDWPTIYEGLSHLPKKIQTSWFNLDHYYSDDAFPKTIPIVMKHNPSRIIDIGGNTGKFAKKLLETSDSLKITILDLPGQIKMAEQNLTEVDKKNQITYHPINILDESQVIPKEHDIIWMSQFLDCFSDEQIISILKRCKDAIDENGRVFIQECFWDKQKFEATAFTLQQFSLYFTAMANGNSQMYDYKTFSQFIQAAGLIIDEEYHQFSLSNSLLICKKA